mgnify:CR=1 FL=1
MSSFLNIRRRVLPEIPDGCCSNLYTIYFSSEPIFSSIYRFNKNVQKYGNV